MKKIRYMSLARHIHEGKDFYVLWIHRGEKDGVHDYIAYPKNKNRIKRMQKLLHAWLWRK